MKPHRATMEISGSSRILRSFERIGGGELIHHVQFRAWVVRRSGRDLLQPPRMRATADTPVVGPLCPWHRRTSSNRCEERIRIRLVLMVTNRHITPHRYGVKPERSQD